MKGFDIFTEGMNEAQLEFYKWDMAQTEAIQRAADIIHDALEQANMSRSELAAKVGVSKGYISRVLSGHENLSVRNVAKILHVLGKVYVQDFKEVSINKEQNNVAFEMSIPNTGKWSVKIGGSRTSNAQTLNWTKKSSTNKLTQVSLNT